MTLSSSRIPIDPRGPRFAAWVSTAVLAVVLVTSGTLLLAAQAVVFALGAFAGLRWHPYGMLYRTLIAPRLAPPIEREDPAPVRFAQGLGLAFAAVGVFGYATGLGALGMTVTALALGAAFLNAAFGFCLGCEIYLRLPLRQRSRANSPLNTIPDNTSQTERGAAA
ncbi:MAG: DUF4395 domain-containing protein [Pseudonocardiaceae bacterium]